MSWCSLRAPVKVAVHTCRAVPAESVRKKRKATWKPNQSTTPPARALNVSLPSTSRVARKL